MSRFTPSVILSEYAAITTINSNFSDISVLLDEMLDRYGDGDNAMQADLDMNHFKIKNLANGLDPTDAVNLGQTLALINAVTATVAATEVITPQKFGAVADGVTNDGAAFVAAIAYLKARDLNGGSINAYKGSPKLFIPAGNYYLGSTTLDITHTLMIYGEGSGRGSSPAYGCTHLRWDDGVCGIRTQFPNTSGTTTVDLVGHDGAGGVYLRDFTMEGGYAGTNSASHAIVVRAITYIDDVLIRNWGGTGVLIWIGNVNGTDYAGNADTSRFTGVHAQDCKIAFDSRGTNANVLTFLNCTAYQCRQAGFVDYSGAGSNTYIGSHATYNGLIGGGSIITQVTYSSKFYAVRWGQEVGAATNAPSGTTADTTEWIYVGTGSVDSSHPAWVSGMSGLLGGGDYITLSPYPTLLLNCYVEGGGFSQLSIGTITLGGTNLGISSQGGFNFVPEYDGLCLKNLHSGAQIHLDGYSGSVQGIDARDSTGSVGGMGWNNQGGLYSAGGATGHVFYTISGGVYTARGSWNTTGINLSDGLTYFINGIQVLGPRQTGWAADTGTAKKTANATYAAGTTLTYSATYVQAEQTAMATRVAALELIIQANSQTIKALKDSLLAHGIIGT